MKDKKWLVYTHISPSNKYYIGITSQNVKKRWRNGNGYKDSVKFYNAIKKYGWDDFKHIVLIDKLDRETANTLNELDDAPVELQKVTDDATTTQSAKCKYVYVETEDNNFHFHDVKIENYDDYLTIYDKDGILKFRCHIDEIVNFMREE